jgi:hypothetical protein
VTVKVIWLKLDRFFFANLQALPNCQQHPLPESSLPQILCLQSINYEFHAGQPNLKDALLWGQAGTHEPNSSQFVFNALHNTALG